MLDHTVTEERRARHSKYQEDFTPDEVVKALYDGSGEELFNDFSKTLCDPCCGVGYILLPAIKERLSKCKTPKDIYEALETIYGVDIVVENVIECRKNIRDCVSEYAKKGCISIDDNEICRILNRNIACSDFYEWDFVKWQPNRKSPFVSLYDYFMNLTETENMETKS